MDHNDIVHHLTVACPHSVLVLHVAASVLRDSSRVLLHAHPTESGRVTMALVDVVASHTHSVTSPQCELSCSSVFICVRLTGN